MVPRLRFGLGYSTLPLALSRDCRLSLCESAPRLRTFEEQKATVFCALCHTHV